MFIISDTVKSYLTVLGTSCIYFAMGLYFAAGNTGVYLTSYLIYRSKSDMSLDDSIWFLSAAGFSALLLPIGGWMEGKVGVRAVCLVGGVLQSLGIFATYFALDTTFLLVVIVYGGSFLVSLACCYTSPMVNVCKWHPKHKGLVTGIGAASMAVAPTIFTPLITALVNPYNVEPNEMGLFNDDYVLDLTKQSTLVQGSITLSLFLIGVVLMFPADDSKNRRESQSEDKALESTKYNNINPSGISKELDGVVNVPRNLDCSTRIIQDYSIEPKFAFKTMEFWLLSLKVLISELIFIYLLFVYKPFGQTFIQDDYFLSAVGAACAISNTVGRLTMGHVKDKLGYRAVSIPLSGMTMFFVLSIPMTKYFNKILYGTWVVLAVGAVGSQYALMPSAAQDSFGDKYASINIGFVYMSTVIATVSSALLSQYLTAFIGWEGMIYLIGLCAFIDFISTFFMPANPHKRLQQRYEQFYMDNNNKIEDTGETKVAPSCTQQITNNQEHNNKNSSVFYENFGFVHQKSDPISSPETDSKLGNQIVLTRIATFNNTKDGLVQIQIDN